MKTTIKIKPNREDRHKELRAGLVMVQNVRTGYTKLLTRERAMLKIHGRLEYQLGELVRVKVLKDEYQEVQRG